MEGLLLIFASALLGSLNVVESRVWKPPPVLHLNVTYENVSYTADFGDQMQKRGTALLEPAQVPRRRRGLYAAYLIIAST